MDDISLKLFQIDSHKLQQQGRGGEENTATEDKVLRNLCKTHSLTKGAQNARTSSFFFKSDRVMQ